MNWRERYSKLKVGDKCWMIKPCLHCAGKDTSRCYESLKGSILTVRKGEYEDGGRIDVEFPNEGGWCSIDGECLVKI